MTSTTRLPLLMLRVTKACTSRRCSCSRGGAGWDSKNSLDEKRGRAGGAAAPCAAGGASGLMAGGERGQNYLQLFDAPTRRMYGGSQQQWQQPPRHAGLGAGGGHLAAQQPRTTGFVAALDTGSSWTGERFSLFVGGIAGIDDGWLERILGVSSFDAGALADPPRRSGPSSPSDARHLRSRLSSTATPNPFCVVSRRSTAPRLRRGRPGTRCYSSRRTRRQGHGWMSTRRPASRMR